MLTPQTNKSTKLYIFKNNAEEQQIACYICNTISSNLLFWIVCMYVYIYM